MKRLIIPTTVLGIIALAGCEAVSPRAINNGPYLILPCVLFCNTELAVEALEDNEGDVTGGAQSQTIEDGEPES